MAFRTGFRVLRNSATRRPKRRRNKFSIMVSRSFLATSTHFLPSALGTPMRFSMEIALKWKATSLIHIRRMIGLGRNQDLALILPYMRCLKLLPKSSTRLASMFRHFLLLEILGHFYHPRACQFAGKVELPGIALIVWTEPTWGCWPVQGTVYFVACISLSCSSPSDRAGGFTTILVAPRMLATHLSKLVGSETPHSNFEGCCRGMGQSRRFIVPCLRGVASVASSGTRSRCTRGNIRGHILGMYWQSSSRPYRTDNLASRRRVWV
eukprot:284815804_4